MNLLNEKERRVLESLFKLGQSTVNQVSKDTLINRTALYHTIDSLSKKGLITKIEKDKISYYESIPIDQYELWANLKIKSAKDEIQTDVQRFMAVSQDKKLSLYADVKYFEGFEAIKNLYYDTIYSNKGRELFSITDYESGYSNIGEWMNKEYLVERVKQGVSVRNIVPDTKYGRGYISSAKGLLRDLCFVNMFKDLGIEINLYDDKIAIVMFDQKHPLGIIIKNEIISKAFREIFNYIWKTGDLVATNKK